MSQVFIIICFLCFNITIGMPDDITVIAMHVVGKPAKTIDQEFH